MLCVRLKLRLEATRLLVLGIRAYRVGCIVLVRVSRFGQFWLPVGVKGPFLTPSLIGS